jgi:PAS domain S-box-containing protein
MSEYDLLQSVEQARHQLTALRTRLENEEMPPRPTEVRRTLGDLQETLEKLQAHYELLCEILARTNDAVFAKDLDGRYVMINRNGAGMFGKTVEEILGHDDSALFERNRAERIMAIDRAIMSTGKPRTFEETTDILGVATTLLTTEAVWYEPRGTLRGLIGTTQDVTERKAVERGAEVQQARLRSLASEIVIAEERLRQSLATDLHSGLGQDIALAKLKLSALRSFANADMHDSLIRIERLIEQADRSLHSITLQLSPPSLHELGLLSALQWLAEDVGARYDLDVKIEDDGISVVASDRVRVILFRAVRELLLNTAKHAGARQAIVSIGSEDSLLRITVKDKGSGFEAAELGLRGHGLFGIREQLAHVGGTMHLDSALGRGTTVVLTAPSVAG